LHTAQLMPLPLTVSCFSKIQIGFTFLVPAHLGSPGQRAVKSVCVCSALFCRATSAVCTLTSRQHPTCSLHRELESTTVCTLDQSTYGPDLSPTDDPPSRHADSQRTFYQGRLTNGHIGHVPLFEGPRTGCGEIDFLKLIILLLMLLHDRTNTSSACLVNLCCAGIVAHNGALNAA